MVPPKPIQVTAPKLQASGPVSADLDELISNIKKEEGTKVDSAYEWNMKNLETVWAEYKAEVESSSSKSALENTILEISGKDILAKVPSNLIKEKIIAEKALQMKLRSSFHDDLSILFEVNGDLFPDYKTIPVKKLLSEEEKYKAMAKKNPNLDNLVKKFKLKIDKT